MPLFAVKYGVRLDIRDATIVRWSRIYFERYVTAEAGNGDESSPTYMGAVMGYGVALQASCLEGFDSLGLHQFLKCSVSKLQKFNF